MGKLSLLMVVAFGGAVLLTALTMGDVRVSAYDNAVRYYETTVVHDIALAGANITANHLFLNPPEMNGNAWFDGYTTPVSFGGGSFVTNLDSGLTDPFTGEKRIRLRSTATYGDSSYTVMAIMGPSRFSKFAVWAGATASAGAYWETGDSALGPVHSQGQLKTIGSPFFGGKTSCKDGVVYHAGATPIFNAGLETGVSIPMNRNYRRVEDAASSGGKHFTGHDDLWLTFAGDSVRYRRIAGDPDTTVYLPDLAPNGVIALGGHHTGNIYVQGIVRGRVTIGSMDSTAGSRGKVIITGNLTYQNDPRIFPASTDMLGIVAYNDVVIADNSAPTFNVDASMFSYTGGIRVENHNSRPPGNLNTLGGWIVEQVHPTSNGVPLGLPGSKGYKAVIRYDERFRFSSPPHFPGTNAYEILAWYE
jgi:hypothetical protein